MDLKQFQMKHKFTDEQMAHNIGMSKRGYIKFRDERSPRATVETVMKVVSYTKLNWADLIDGLEHLKHITTKICRSKKI